MSGGLDVGALGLALSDVVGRHEVCGAVLREVMVEPVQVVLPGGWGGVGALVCRWVRVGAVGGGRVVGRVVFDLAVEPPLRVWLLGLVLGSFVGGLLHHSVSDGWSVGAVPSGFGVSVYGLGWWVGCRWCRLPVQYADYRGVAAGVVGG